MVALIFNAPPINPAVVDLGDNEHVTSDGEVLTWREMHLRHLSSKALHMQEAIGRAETERDAGWSMLSWVSGEMATYDIEHGLNRLDEEIPEMQVVLDDLMRYIEYRKSINAIHGR
ncbi:hypothetical protein [Rhizobium phage RHph_X3_2]|nr:hypothetical protein [Rhizobium phage RHph_X3_2]